MNRITRGRTLADVSPDFRWDKKDLQTIKKILPYEATPEAIKLFARYAWRLTDYGYWFLLSTLWVSYCGWSNLEEWKQMFSSVRPNRETSLMKPSELETLRNLGDTLAVFRAHRPGEQDWISYTLSPLEAAKFALRRGVDKVSEYQVARVDVLALFLRRGELEVIVLDKTRAQFVREIEVRKELP